MAHYSRRREPRGGGQTVAQKLHKHFFAGDKPDGPLDRERIETLFGMGIVVLSELDAMFDPYEYTEGPVLYLHHPGTNLKPLEHWLEALVWIEAHYLLTRHEIACNMTEVRRECWAYVQILRARPPMPEGELLAYMVKHTRRDPDLASRQP